MTRRDIWRYELKADRDGVTALLILIKTSDYVFKTVYFLFTSGDCETTHSERINNFTLVHLNEFYSQGVDLYVHIQYLIL